MRPQWISLIGRDAARRAKLINLDECVLIHEERIPPNFGREDMPDHGSIRIWYDPLEDMIFRETAYQRQPSRWEMTERPLLCPHCRTEFMDKGATACQKCEDPDR